VVANTGGRPVSGVLAFCLAAALCSTADADIDPLSGIDFVRITHPGNAPYIGSTPPIPGDNALGRGSVGYEYNIGRFEVTTSQWVQFFNAAFDRPANDRLPHLIPPTFWGAAGAPPTVPGGLRWQVPAGNEMRPVGNISWRMAAMYCNWLHNDKSTARSAFLDGAYDVSTFGSNGMGGFNDQATRSPGARYFIPTWDEHLKASHFDPDRFGENQPGWWTFNNRTDVPVPGGPPGAHVRIDGPPGPDPNGPLAQANYGWDQFTFPGYGSPYSVPLGAYPDVQSPWGLLDVAGATTEWVEEIRTLSTGDFMFRVSEGSEWDSPTGSGIGDAIWSRWGAEFPYISTGEFGFRIASVVPAPSTAMVCFSGCVALVYRRRRRGELAAGGTSETTSLP